MLWDWLDEENRIGSISNSLNASVLLKASITQSSTRTVTCVLGLSAWRMLMWSGCDHITSRLCQSSLAPCVMWLCSLDTIFMASFSMCQKKERKLGKKCCKWLDSGFTQQKEKWMLHKGVGGCWRVQGLLGHCWQALGWKEPSTPKGGRIDHQNCTWASSRRERGSRSEAAPWASSVEYPCLFGVNPVVWNSLVGRFKSSA